MERTSAISILLERCSIVVNFSPRLMLTRNRILLTNIIKVDTSSSLSNSRISLGISTYSARTLAGLRLTDLPFNKVTPGPKIVLAFFYVVKGYRTVDDNV